MQTPFAEGIAALRAGDFGTAERILLSIVERNPSEHAAWQALSVAAVRAGMPDIAVVRAKRAVALDRGNADYLNSLGVAYGETDQLLEAEHAFRRALKRNPSYAEAHYNLARVLRRQGRISDALKEYERAHALQPASLPFELGLAAMYRQMGRSDLALGVLRETARRTPNEERISYLAACIADAEGPEAAISGLRELLTQQPNSRHAHYALAQLLLALGRWREGWKDHLWRPHGDLASGRAAPAVLPLRLDGKRVLLRAEYGIGDVLFFLRFAGELRSRGAQVALERPPQFAKLAPLLADYVEITQPAAADLQISLADLPSLLETEATPPVLALRADPGEGVRSREMLARLGPPPYLGLTWRAGTNREPYSGSGGPPREVRLSKEISPALLGQVARGWPGTVVSLQRGARLADLEAVRAAAGAAVHDLAAAIEEPRQGLGLLGHLDEYVAVSNTNVHLLAGLGRSARVLVPELPEWRWMLQGRSVWFPACSVYRQSTTLEWPLERLREELARDRQATTGHA